MTIFSPNFNGSIPGADSADNGTPADVVGNKDDTTAGDSLVSLVKIADAAIDVVDGLQDVPSADSADNANARDVIGNKDDTVAGDSLVSLVKVADAAIDTVDGLLDVPAQNAADNAHIRDVIGNKTDTSVGTSLVSMVLMADEAIDVVDGLLDVPAQNVADNAHIRDVVGNKTDYLTSAGITGGSIYAILDAMYDHFHQPQQVYPTLADGSVVVAGGGGWQLGDFTDVIPVGTVATDFDIHFVNVEAASATDTYEIVLYDGADVEISRCRFTKSAAQDLQGAVPVQCPVQPAGGLIRAKCASSSGGADTITISLEYHGY